MNYRNWFDLIRLATKINTTTEGCSDYQYLSDSMILTVVVYENKSNKSINRYLYYQTLTDTFKMTDSQGKLISERFYDGHKYLLDVYTYLQSRNKRLT